VLIAATMVFLWWRSVSLSQQDHTFQTVGYEFRRNVLLLIFSTLILSYSGWCGKQCLYCTLLFLLLDSGGLGSCQGQEPGLRRHRAAVWPPLAWHPDGIELASPGAGWSLESIYSVAGWRRLLNWLSPVFEWLEQRPDGWLSSCCSCWGRSLSGWSGSSGTHGLFHATELLESPLEDLLQQLEAEAAYPWARLSGYG